MLHSSEKFLEIVTYPQFSKFFSVKVPSNFGTFKCNCTLEHFRNFNFATAAKFEFGKLRSNTGEVDLKLVGGGDQINLLHVPESGIQV
jgi:hypothetical protein